MAIPRLATVDEDDHFGSRANDDDPVIDVPTKEDGVRIPIEANDDLSGYLATTIVVEPEPGEVVTSEAGPEIPSSAIVFWERRPSASTEQHAPPTPDLPTSSLEECEATPAVIPLADAHAPVDHASALASGRLFGQAIGKKTAITMVSGLDEEQLRRVGADHVGLVVARANEMAAEGGDQDLIAIWTQAASDAFAGELDKVIALLTKHETATVAH